MQSCKTPSPELIDQSLGDSMSTVTVLMPHESIEVEGQCVDDLALVDRTSLNEVLGWELKPQGLCRENECIPVKESDLLHGDCVDLRAAATAVGVTSMLADDTDLVALSVPSQARSDALTRRRAPNFVLPDLDGEDHSLEQFQGRKRLLVAFASW